MNKTICGSCGNMEVVVLEEKGMDPLPGRAPGQWMEPDGAGLIAKRKKAKKRRLRTLGAWDATIPKGKSLEDDEDPAFFLCGMDRKVHPVSDAPCAACPGGCHEEKGLPTLLEVEGLAEEYFDMKVLDSGYGAQADLFIVHVERKDGRVVEAIYGGSTAELEGWHLLDDQVLSGKSFEDGAVNIITSEDASEVAQKHFDGGEVITVDADTFEGQDAWVVEMTTNEGEAVDVYVGLDGTTLGYDVYEKTLADDDETKDDETNEEVDPEVVGEVSDEVVEGEIKALVEGEDEVKVLTEEEDVSLVAEPPDKLEEKTADVGSLLRDLAELESISTGI